jgi:tRNA(adenine34) deaminase
MHVNKEFFMKKAHKQALVAFKRNEVPIGAVIVDQNGLIIARAYNNVEAIQCQTGHAEVRAIEKACKKRGGWRLNGCWIYVTLEPCLMCFGLIQISRLEGIIFGAQSPLFGAGLNNSENTFLYAKNIIIQGGIMEQQSIDLLQLFFNKARKKASTKNEEKKRTQ